MNNLNPERNPSDKQYDEKNPHFGEAWMEPEFKSMSVDLHEDGSVKTITVFVEYVDVDYETDIGVRFNVKDGVACHQTRVVTQLKSDLCEVYAIMKAEDHLRDIINRFPSSVERVEHIEDALFARIDDMRVEMNEAGYL